mmetsp:Transcript_9760/g.29578  ORF Transcript_9760/g.29578 Transcript_9760/m.29578 type:complete len:216 (+) Transcript_9760:232-879(+)
MEARRDLSASRSGHRAAHSGTARVRAKPALLGDALRAARVPRLTVPADAAPRGASRGVHSLRAAAVSFAKGRLGHVAVVAVAARDGARDGRRLFSRHCAALRKAGYFGPRSVALPLGRRLGRLGRRRTHLVHLAPPRRPRLAPRRRLLLRLGRPIRRRATPRSRLQARHLRSRCSFFFFFFFFGRRCWDASQRRCDAAALRRSYYFYRRSCSAVR